MRLALTLSLSLPVLALVACQAAPPTPRPTGERQPVPGGPTLLWAGLDVRKVADAGAGSVRLVQHPVNGDLYVLSPGRGIVRVSVEAGTLKLIAPLPDIAPGANPTGLAIGADGTLFVALNRTEAEKYNVALIRRGAPRGEDDYEWNTVAETEPYPLSGTPFDHQFNGLAVSPDGQWLFINSGSRTDHGEEETNKGAFPKTREVPLTARLFRLPSEAVEVKLPNDEAALAKYAFARGLRNAYDLAFAPNRELFAVDNGPDADYADELNWIREGAHYGYPWRFGHEDNPQQFPDYTGVFDKRLAPDFTAVQIGAYRADPTFPKPPGPFTDPVRNLGPDAARNRDAEGNEYDAAAEGKPIHTFTPHRSPLGLVFATGDKLPADLRGPGDGLHAFVLSWGAAGGTLSDKGQDLLHLRLTRTGENYQAVTTQIARGFQNPIDAALIENRLYVLDFGGNGAIWELTFE